MSIFQILYILTTSIYKYIKVFHFGERNKTITTCIEILKLLGIIILRFILPQKNHKPMPKAFLKEIIKLFFRFRTFLTILLYGNTHKYD